MNKIRVLVVDDSLTVRKRLVEILSARDNFEVVGEAENGIHCIELCKSQRPDVITMDMVMPVMNGMAATQYIMAYCPTPILIVSASVNRAGLFNTYEALAAGAVDVMDKPEAEDWQDDWVERFCTHLALISRIKVITHQRGRWVTPEKSAAVESATANRPTKAIRAVAIGASTGGPEAILKIVKGLPPTFPIPILLTLHLNKTFGSAFAEWLDSQCPLPVAYANDGDHLPVFGHGKVILAPPDEHLRLHNGRLWLDRGPERYSCRPSVDVMFESVAGELGSASAGCLLTGMGDDGAAGLLAIRRAGGVTLAQDEASCVVFGMPRKAILLGAAEKVLPLNDFAQALISLTNGGAA